MFLGLNPSLGVGQSISPRTMQAPRTAMNPNKAPYWQYRRDFERSINAGPSSTQTWSPQPFPEAPTATGTTQHQISIPKIAEAVMGRGAQPLLSLVASILPSLATALSTGGFTLVGALGASGLFNYFSRGTSK